MSQAPDDVVELLSIKQLAAAAGLGPARIRNWEHHWGWPAAVCDAQGHRRYPANLIPHLREAARRSDSGRSLRDDIVDGVPVWLSDRPRPRPVAYDLTRCVDVPFPRTPEGQRLRTALLQALVEQNEPGVGAVLARLPTIHPDDREAAVIGVLRAIDHPAAGGVPAAVVRGEPHHISDMEIAQITAAASASAPDVGDLTTAEQVTCSSSDQPMPVRIDQIATPVASSTAPTDMTTAMVADPQTAAAAPEPRTARTTRLAMTAANPPEQSHPAVAAPATAQPAAVRPRNKRQISDDTWAEWQTTLARQAQARRREQASIAARKARAASFRHLRHALQQLDVPAGDPAVQRLAADTLAVRVHVAPEHIRTVLAALLASLSSRRVRR